MANILEAIALKYLNVEALANQKRDELDFHDISVWQLKEALKAAYEAGQNAAKGDKA